MGRTFTWDNHAFDGPVVPRDLAFDVPDRLEPVGDNYPGLLNLGWPLGPTGAEPLALHADGVYNIAKASGALLTLNLSADDPVTVSYRFNGNTWHNQAWPFATDSGAQTLAVPVPLSDLRPGRNDIEILTSDYGVVANLDLILVAAGGTGGLPFADGFESSDFMRWSATAPSD